MLLVLAYIQLQNKRYKKLLSVLVILAVITELTLNAYYITSQFELRSNADTKEYIVEISNLLNRIEGDDYFRIEKDSFISLNDPMLFGYKGLNHFSSVQDRNNEEILSMLGYSGIYMNGTFATAPANALLGLEYIISSSPYIELFDYTAIAKQGEHTLYMTDLVLPFAYYCEGEDTSINNNPFVATNQIYSAIVNNDTPLYVKISYEIIESVSEETNTYWVQLEDTSEEGFYYVYFTPKTDGSSLIMNGKDYGISQVMYSKGIVPLGYHSDEFSFSLNTYELEVYRLDMEVFKEYINHINAQVPNNITIRDNIISFETQKKGTILLSMPYYEDWVVRINGAKSSLTNRFRYFAAIEIEEQNSLVTLRYRPKGTILGIVITTCSSMVLIYLFLKETNILRPMSSRCSNQEI